MSELAVVLWLLGYPVSLSVMRHTNSAIGLYDYTDRTMFSDGVRALGEFWTLAVWVGVAVWLKP